MLGPILAVLLMLFFSGGIRAAMWVAVIPAVLAVIVIAVLVREPEQKQARCANRSIGVRRENYLAVIGSS